MWQTRASDAPWLEFDPFASFDSLQAFPNSDEYLSYINTHVDFHFTSGHVQPHFNMTPNEQDDEQFAEYQRSTDVYEPEIAVRLAFHTNLRMFVSTLQQYSHVLDPSEEA